jgi:peptide chain release factor 2
MIIVPSQISDILNEIDSQMNVWEKHLKSLNAFEKFVELKAKIENPNLWDDPEMARGIVTEYSQVKESTEAFANSKKQKEDIFQLLENADDSMLILLFEEVQNLQNQVNKVYINTLFSNKEDASNCFLTVHSGSGGQESEDWARMLWEMYLKYASSFYDVKILDELFSDDGGIKSATMKISSKDSSAQKFPYGWFKSEIGVHRLVRISPYDKKKQRHTSFASVATTPEISDNVEIEIEEKDLRIDTYRASGAGGQHVNKTESAIRITHIPTGIVVQCQNDRSQHRNKDEAFKVLRSRLFEYQKNKLKKEMQQKEDEKKEITWGSQIRSYVKDPYQMVKDHRTNHELPNFQKVVFEAEIAPFMIAFLKSNIAK